MKKIDKQIVSFSVKSEADKTSAAAAAASAEALAKEDQNKKTEMNEKIERPEILIGSTYKIAKSPSSEHALYVTINDIVLDFGTEHERRRPFEIFINSKNMDQFQWIVAMTRILSAVFRKGGDVTFLVDEMKAVFDPHGGYFRKGGYVPSIIAEIGGVIETHLKDLGIIESQIDASTQALIDEKRKAYDLATNNAPVAIQPDSSSSKASSSKASPSKASSSSANEKNSASSDDAPMFPPTATMCKKCNNKAIIIMDGCATCLNCGYSKCG